MLSTVSEASPGLRLSQIFLSKTLASGITMLGVQIIVPKIITLDTSYYGS